MTKEKRCCMCNETPEECEANGAHTIIRSPVTNVTICSTCVKGLYGAVTATEKAMMEALVEASAAKDAGIRRNENDECMCLMHIFERKQRVIEGTSFKASEVYSGTKH